MVQKRPATFSSTPLDERGRIGNRSPHRSSDFNSNNRVPKARASTAASNPSLDADSFLPQIAPVRKMVSPQRKPPQQENLLTPPKRQRRPSVAAVAPAGTPRSARAQEGKRTPRRSTNDSAVNLDLGMVKAVGAAAAVSPRRPSRTAAPKSGIQTDIQQPNRYRRRPTMRRDGTRSPVSKQQLSERQAVAKEEEVALTAEETLLLCGVQPGSSKALWVTSMLSQLDSRVYGSASLFSDADGIHSIPGSSRAPHQSPSPSTSLAARSSAASFLSGPLQVPEELLKEEKKVNRVAHPPPAPATHPPPRAARSSLSPLPRDAARTPPSIPVADKRRETSSEEEDDDAPTSDGEGSPSTTHSTDEDVSKTADDDEKREKTEEKEEEEEEKDSEESYSPSPTKFGSETTKPISEAADLLAKLRIAVAHRKAEPPPVDLAALHLHRLRPSRRQLHEYRVHVLSLDHARQGTCSSGE